MPSGALVLLCVSCAFFYKIRNKTKTPERSSFQISKNFDTFRKIKIVQTTSNRVSRMGLEFVPNADLHTDSNFADLSSKRLLFDVCWLLVVARIGMSPL
jgi:hypothetical protein